MKVLVPIVGMHRSGTSATAGALSHLGVDFGPESLLMPPSPANPRGYFEHLPVVQRHDRALRAMGASWKDPKLPPDWLLREPGQQLVDWIARWMRGLQGPGPHGLKDPRMTLFAAAWMEAAAAEGVDLRPVVVIRRWPAVVASLSRRDGMAVGMVRELIHVYGQGTMEWMRLGAHAFRFEHLLSDPAGMLMDMVSSIELKQPTPEQLAAAVAFIDEDLTHG